MDHSKLDENELNRRCDEVFNLDVGEYIYDIFIADDNSVCVSMRETDIDFIYKPNMVDRPEALSYLMGDRNDFND